MGHRTVSLSTLAKAAALAALATAAGAVAGFVVAFGLASLWSGDQGEWTLLFRLGAGILFGLPYGGLLGATIAWGRLLAVAVRGQAWSKRRLAVVCGAGFLAMLGSAPLAFADLAGSSRHAFAWVLVILYAPPALAVVASGWLTRAWPVAPVPARRSETHDRS